MKKSKIIFIISILIIAVGLGIILTPIATDLYYKNKVKTEEKDFDKKVQDSKKSKSKEDVIDIEGLYALMHARNEEYKLKENIDYNGTSDDDIDLNKYGIHNGSIGYVDIPKLKVHLPIVLGGSDANLEKGACHITGTSYPIGGKGTNSVLSAHRQYTWTRMFRDIHRLRYGDEVIINNFKEKLEYQVVEKYLVNAKNYRPTLIDKEKDLVTLASCEWNYEYNTYDRYIVVCERVN